MIIFEQPTVFARECSAMHAAAPVSAWFQHRTYISVFVLACMSCCLPATMLAYVAQGVSNFSVFSLRIRQRGAMHAINVSYEVREDILRENQSSGNTPNPTLFDAAWEEVENLVRQVCPCTRRAAVFITKQWAVVF